MYLRHARHPISMSHLVTSMLIIVQTTVAVPSTFGPPDLPSPADTLQEWTHSRNLLSKQSDQTGLDYWGAQSRKVLQINGTAEDVISATFYPESGRTATDYDFVFVVNNSEILEPTTDVSLAKTQSGTQLNLTAAVDFNKFPGKVQLTIEARLVADGSLYDFQPIHYIVAGMAVYTLDTRTLISGSGRSFRVASYEDIYKKPHWDFDVFVQFLNGSDSLSILGTFHPASFFALADIHATFMSYSGQILWDRGSCSIADGDWDGREVLLKPGCGAGFSVGSINNTLYDGFHFAYDFEKDRAGRIDVFLEWEEFTVGSEFEDEEYTNYILAEIGGVPPVVVTQIEPGNPFDKDGGEEIYVEMFNAADVTLTSFDVNDIPFYLVPDSKSIVSGPDEFYESARFLTSPGTGKKLPWTISGTRVSHAITGEEYEEIVKFVDRTGFLFSYDDEDIIVRELIPQVASESGWETAVLTGKFGSFSAQNPEHNIIIGNTPLQKSLIQKATSEEITFSIPARIDIGAGWSYDVLVQMGNSFSVPRTLEYLPSALKIQQQVFGASSELDSDVHTVSHCGNSTYVATLQNHNGISGSYNWKVLNSSKYDLLQLENASSVVKNTDTLLLPNSYLPQFDTIFTIVAEVIAGNLSTSSVFLVKRSSDIVVGVSLIQPENRTISYPQVNVRVVAKIEIPECYDGPLDLTYDWEFENKAQSILESERQGVIPVSVHDATLKPSFDIFSYPPNANSSVSGSIVTARLGRELYVSRDHLSHGLHRIRLTVHSGSNVNNTKLFGVAGTSLSVSESMLKATIGSGQLSRRASDAEDLYMTGQGSLDPDVISGENPAIGLTYHWGCAYSLMANFSDYKNCTTELLPLEAQNSSIFKVAKESLQSFSKLSLEDDEGKIYLRYTLEVSKNERKGSTSQAVALVRADDRKLASYDRIDVFNSRGEKIECDCVEFWEDVIINPVAPSVTEWRFRLEYPLSEKAQFLASNSKLIENPGYYSVTGGTAPGFQRLPLGIKADELLPHQEYTFSITLQEPGKLSEEVYLTMKTREVPKLIFPQIQSSNATVNTIFRSVATTTFPGNSSFTYQFYLMELGKSTREYCVDGCTGANVVRFQVAKPGLYLLQCRLLSANGRTLLAIKNNTATIRVHSSSSATEMEQFDIEMKRDFRLGDDGAVNQKGFFVTQSMYERDGQVVAMSDDSGEEACVSYALKWAAMSRQILRNEHPNTANARNYVTLASNFVRLRCVEEAQTLYELLGIVDDSISRTPQEETLTTVPFSHLEQKPVVELEEELVRFYNFSRTRILSTIAAGSSRARLVPIDGEVNNIILDISEMWMKHITAAATSGRVCGWEATYTSSSVDGESDQTLLSSGSRNAGLGVSTTRVAVKCNKEQGNSLSTPFASFSWCDSVYEMSGSERKLITVSESFDYPYLSGVQGLNQSDSARLVMVDITTLSESNKLVSAMSDNAVTAQAESNSSEVNEVQTCYRIGLTMGDVAIARTDECSENVPYHTWPRKTFGHQVSRPFESGLYQRRTVGVKVTPETRNDSRSVVALSNILGLYGAYRTTCSVGLFGTPSIVGGSATKLSGILMGILVITLLLVGLTYTLFTTLFAAIVEDEEAVMLENYVERDFFGRGQVRLNFVTDDDDEFSVSSSGTGGDGLELSHHSMESLEEALDLQEEQSRIPSHSSLLAAAQSDLPERPPS